MSNRAAKEVELAPSLVSIKDVELAPGPKQPGYWRKHWATPDPFLGQAIAPYPLPRTRGLHEWAVYVSQDPARSVTARSLAPLASIAVTLVQFLVLLLYGFETMMPSCGSHADCNRGQFCAAPSTTLCIDCKWAINGTNPYAAAPNHLRPHCATVELHSHLTPRHYSCVLSQVRDVLVRFSRGNGTDTLRGRHS